MEKEKIEEYCALCARAMAHPYSTEGIMNEMIAQISRYIDDVEKQIEEAKEVIRDAQEKKKVMVQILQTVKCSAKSGCY